MDLGLKGKVALITGSSRGIGFSIAEAFLNEGASVAICARNSERLVAARKELSEKGEIFATALDVSQSDAFIEFKDQVKARFGRIDVFVSNVSAQSRDLAESARIDLLTTSACVEAVLPELRLRQGSSIVGIASQAALVPSATFSSYAAVKAALISYFSSLALRLAPENIRVNTVSPGEVLFAGGIWDRLRTERPEKYEAAVKKNPLGRLATPEEIASVVVFAASSAASFVSGANILVDGAGRQFTQF